jgi:hypothetical protein
VATKIDLERMHLVEANRMIAEKNPILHIPNCGITQYSRVNPFNPNDIHNHLLWVREIDPMDPPAGPIWREINREKMNSQELKQLVQTYGIN